MLDVESLTVGYRGEPAVQDVNLQVSDGEFVALLGANGAGKTTLLRAIMSLERPMCGVVRLHGRETTALPPDRIVSLGVALVPEGRQLFPGLSVRDNLMLGWFSRRRKEPQWRGRLDRCLSIFPELEPRLGSVAAALSGGQQQMLAVGRALMSDPQLLILDEPSFGLAPLLCDRIFGVLGDLHREGRSILLVEQNARLSLQISQRSYILERGKVVRAGPSNELLHDPSVQEYYLGGADTTVATPAPSNPGHHPKG